MATHRADSKYMIIIGIVDDIFVRANMDSWFILSCFMLSGLNWVGYNTVSSNSSIGVDRGKISFGIRADK